MSPCNAACSARRVRAVSVRKAQNLPLVRSLKVSTFDLRRGVEALGGWGGHTFRHRRSTVVAQKYTHDALRR